MYASVIKLMCIFIFDICFGSHINFKTLFGNNFEIAECEIKHIESKSDILYRKKRESIHSPNIEISIKSANRSFNLHLFKDDLFYTIPIQTNSSVTYNKKYNNNTKFYEGIVKNGSYSSLVMGYLHNGAFSGVIFDNGEMFVSEPVHDFLPNIYDPGKVVLYRAQSFSPFTWSISPNITASVPPWRVSFHTAKYTGRSKLLHRGKDLGNRKHDLYCEIEIVVDHTLYDYFEKDIDKLSAYLYLHARHADKIFRQADFTFDGKPDGVRIVIKKISVYRTPGDDNYPMANATDLADYLNRLALRYQDERFCLSVSFSFRNFSGFVIGEAFKPELGIFGPFGGICEDPFLMQEQTTMSFNVASINLNTEKHIFLPLAFSLLAFAHELGHSFGSEHDHPDSEECNSNEYLMNAEAVNTFRYVHKFSPCSRKEIREIIEMKGGCLKDRRGVCGNLVREGTEECDCGPKSICDFVDPCCTPSDVDPTKKGCTFKSKFGFECSRKETECCYQNCTIAKEENIRCYVDHFLCLESFCNGVSPNCPVPQKNLSHTFCHNTKLSFGLNHSVCTAHRYTDCLCLHDKENECIVCCTSGDNCVPASYLGILNAEKNEYVRPYGSRCNKNRGYCNRIGQCVSRKSFRNDHAALYISLTTIFISLLIMVSAVMALARRRIHLNHVRLLRYS